MRLNKSTEGFSLAEVAIAIGVFTVAIVALIAVLTSSIKSSEKTFRAEESLFWVDYINASFLSDEIYQANPETLQFDDFARWIASSNAFLYAWAYYEDGKVVHRVSSQKPTVNIESIAKVPFIIFLKKGMQSQENPYDFSNINNRAFIPVLVELYPLDAAKMIYQDFDIDSLKSDLIKPVFYYTTTKLR